MRKVAIGQAGGPTAVINASLAGVVEGLYGKCTIFPVLNGYQGLVERKYTEMNEGYYRWILQNADVPGACLGSGRFHFTPELMEQAVLGLKEKDIRTLIFIGGNGTMAALKKLEQIAEHIGYELQIIGIPKTVDNDLGETDHAPGFGSAARYITLSVRNIVKDLEAMRNFEQVRIIETMGRNAGWLALSSGFLRRREEDGPHHIYVPEEPVSQESFLEQIEETVKTNGTAVVVVSEGFRFSGEQPTEREVVKGRKVLGGVSLRMERMIREQTGYHVRAENLGMNQRSASFAVSSQDRKEAYEVGLQAALYVKQKKSSIMVNIQRKPTKCYNYIIGSTTLERVARSGEKTLPRRYLENLTEYYHWLEPILGDRIEPYPAKWRAALNG